MSTIDYTDAEKLEQLELEELRVRRTRRAIADTYGDESPTKKRHKLSGKRKWKNKRRQYNELSGALTAKQFNINQKRQEVLRNIYKKRAKRESLAD